MPNMTRAPSGETLTDVRVIAGDRPKCEILPRRAENLLDGLKDLRR